MESPMPSPESDEWEGTTGAPVNIKTIRDFRNQIHALGAVWIILGARPCYVAASAANLFGDHPSRGEGQLTVAICFGAVGALWLALGVLTCLKKLWAVYSDLGLSYLAALSQLVSGNVLIAVLFVLVILQAHRVIGWANRMQVANVPLTARPGDYL
jgi:hypothetical protein